MSENQERYSPSASASNLETRDRLRPDDIAEFRMAQLLLVLVETRSSKQKLDLERLSISDFLAANPFLVISDEQPEYLELRLAGFGEHSLSYAAPGQRYATRRERVMNDLARLVSLGLVVVEIADERRVLVATEAGVGIAEKFTSVYADAYRASIRRIAPRLAGLSDRALRASLSGWLRADPVLFDLLDIELDTETDMFFKVDDSQPGSGLQP